MTPPEPASTPEAYRRSDGSSTFRPKHGTVYTSTELLAAEDRLLALADTTSGPRADPAVRPHADKTRARTLSAEQQTTVERLVASGRVVDVLVGAAGAGKTSTMHGLRLAWEQAHGPGSVVGLAPSARAADVLATELSVRTENTAKWLHEHHTGRWNLKPGQLVIVDEASLAATPVLDEIAARAAAIGAKVLLVGDPAQLGAVGAGGAFALLAGELRSRGLLAELTDVRRFRHAWEKHASLRLRDRDTTVLDVYDAHSRLVGGQAEDMTETAYVAWRADIAAGRTSLLVAEAQDTVTALNARARADRIHAGHVDTGADATGPGVRLHDGTRASRGDLVVTRHNERRLLAGRGFVRNGDCWTVLAAHRDGSIRVRRAGARFGATVTLPAAYVAAHVELGYATTVHRAQGMTVDTTHALATGRMTAEAFYVAMTRGRHRNTAYVATDQPDLEPHHHHLDQTGDEPLSAKTVLTAVLRHVGAEPSAHQVIRDEQNRWTSIAQLAAEYDTIATEAQKTRWEALLRRSLPNPADAETVLASQAFAPLATALRRAEATATTSTSSSPPWPGPGAVSETPTASPPSCTTASPAPLVLPLAAGAWATAGRRV